MGRRSITGSYCYVLCPSYLHKSPLGNNCPHAHCAYSVYWAQQEGFNCSEYSFIYWYHPDYLGNTEYITDMAGEPYQYFWHSPWGETWVDQHAGTGSYSSPYRFNAKEWDGETGNYYYGARYYSPSTSLWLSVDPMASNGLNLTPYSFSFNNPVVFLDPDGNWPYRIFFRSFHPDYSFGSALYGLTKGFAGDDRPFSLSDNVTSRIVHQVVADPAVGTVSYTGRGKSGTYSDWSHHPIWGTAKDNPNGYVGNIESTINSISFLTGYDGKNPLIWSIFPNPKINVDAKLSIAQVGDVLTITGKVNGDDFPNTEAFIEDPSGNRLFLGQDRRAAGQDHSPTALFGPSTEKIMDINMRIQIDPANGNFLKILNGGGQIQAAPNASPRQLSAPASSPSNGGGKNPRWL